MENQADEGDNLWETIINNSTNNYYSVPNTSFTCTFKVTTFYRVAGLAKFSPKCENWRNFESTGEILKLFLRHPILARFGEILRKLKKLISMYRKENFQ